jgi:hypothetical protein
VALLDKPAVDVQRPIDPEAALHALHTGLWEDSSALQMVVQDTIRAENYEGSKQWVMQWPTAATLYQSPYSARYWEGTQTERANVPFFTVATATNSLVPQILNGLFYENPPFMIQQRPGTSAQASRAVGHLLAYQLEDIGFREELRLGVTNTILFGTGIWKWGWETFTRERKIYRRKTQPLTIPSPIAGTPDVQISDEEEDLEEESIEEYVDRPVFEHIVNLRHVLVDPGLNVPDIRKAKYVIHRQYLSWNQLDRLRDRPGFNIPSREDLLMLFFPPKEEAKSAISEISIRNPLWDARSEARFEDTTVDPFNQPLEVLERWDEKQYIVVLQQKLVICNDDNPYGVIPFLSVGWWDVPEAFWSMGLAKTIGSEQRLQQGVTNLWIDNAALNLNGVYVRVRGKSVPTQSIRISPGKIVEVDNKDDFKVMDRLPAVPEAAEHLSLSQQRAEQVSGANEMSSQGVAGASGHSNAARSAAGISMLTSGAGNRTSDFVEKLASQVIIPFLYAAHELNRALMPVSTIRYILGEELEDEYMKANGDVIELLNARVKFSILAAAKMQARKNMSQALPILVQFLTNEQTTQQLAVAGYRVDVVEIMRMFFEVSDWKNFNDVVVKMTPEEKQRFMQMQPGAQAQARQQQMLQAQSGQIQQKHQNAMELVDNENMNRAGREVLRHALETEETPEAVGGEPGTQGFGSSA